MRRLLVLSVSVVTLALVGVAAAAPPSYSVGAGSSRYGQVLFDGHGYALYLFTRDPKALSKCTGACAKAWPPYVVTRKPHSLPGASAKLLGTTHRADGTLQVTYAGHPLYYYVGDTSPGAILCQNVLEYGGYWLVVNPNGTANRTKP
jgi:predicted lipoprotein with Yx(FWY)xxD motif